MQLTKSKRHSNSLNSVNSVADRLKKKWGLAAPLYFFSKPQPVVGKLGFRNGEFPKVAPF